MMDTPQFEHDCKQCKFLGRYTDLLEEQTSRDYDLYWCPQGTIPTVIARYGNEGSLYLSGMPNNIKFYLECPEYPLHEAYNRAKAAGYQVSTLLAH